jgi:hypothetical protein
LRSRYQLEFSCRALKQFFNKTSKLLRFTKPTRNMKKLLTSPFWPLVLDYLILFCYLLETELKIVEQNIHNNYSWNYLGRIKSCFKSINSYFTDLTVSGDKIATYKGVPWTVNGKHITSQTLVNVQIK